MSQILTVSGATGNQGGSVIRHVLAGPALSKTFKIRAVTRDVTQPSARSLAGQGVEVVAVGCLQMRAPTTGTPYTHSHAPWADLNPQDCIREAIEGSHTVFLATAEIEKHIRESGVPATFYVPGSFMTNYVPQLQRAPDGSITLAYPVRKDTRFPLIDIAEDTGKFVKAIIKNRDSLLGKQVFAATDYYTPEQMVKDLEDVTGKPARYVQITGEEFASRFPEHIARLFLENLVFMETFGYFNGARLDESLLLLEERSVT